MGCRGSSRWCPEVHSRASGIAAIAVNQRFIDRCIAIRNQDDSNPTFYLDILPALKKGSDDQTPWTPAINPAMGWAAALETLKEEGLENRWNRCKMLAEGVRKLFLDLGFELLADEFFRSSTVTAICTLKESMMIGELG